MPKSRFQRLITLLQQGAWLQLESAERKSKRWLMWKAPNGQIVAEALLKDDFRYLITSLSLHRVEQSAKVTRFVMRIEHRSSTNQQQSVQLN